MKKAEEYFIVFRAFFHKKSFKDAPKMRCPIRKNLFDGVLLGALFISLCFINSSYAQDGFGQVIRIRTLFNSFIGKPSWLVVIRDVDHDENIPYLFDIRRGENYWVIPTYSRNYLILASTLKISTYRSRTNTFSVYRIDNFCNLETEGRILRNESIFLTISGYLSPYDNSYQCQLSRYKDAVFNYSETSDP